MLTKDKLIMEAAIKLFSTKGYDATSINDIVSECGISKGSFYSYFKSKNTLLFETLSYCFNNLQKRVESVEKQDLDPRTKFIQQLTCFFEGVVEYKEFLIMHEQTIPLGESVKKVILQKRNKMRTYYREGLLSLYGDKITDYLWDLSIMMEGMFYSYIRLFLIDEKKLEIDQLSTYIMNRMDDIVEGLQRSEEKPILSEKKVGQIHHLLGESITDKQAELNEVLYIVREELNNLSDNDEYIVSLDVLEEELLREKTRKPVLQGMLSNLEDAPQIAQHIEKLKGLLI
ncbi:TetR/AcrR family transcriptional regulator [Evansella halocellulosilytica]|uniref:TetR/AcrR family transcriptional regulator n=1 Tax=Evansella halocellulosilytica TaxID=2011013 RepID=UPI000BB95D3A|nr:TetR/AcrR family transcriptional regulator [Evansella halocellulosilytica]